MSRLALAVLVVVSALVAACGGGDAGNSGSSAMTPAASEIVATVATSVPTPSPTTFVSPTATPSPVATTVPTATSTTLAEPTATETASVEPTPSTPFDPDLSKALIRLDELPAGWTVSADEDDDNESSFCDAPGSLAEVSGVIPIGKAEAAFESEMLGQVLTQSISRYDNDDAAKVMATIAETLSCERWVSTGDDGAETIWTFQELTFPNLGDEIFARRGTAATDVVGLELDLVVVRDGDTIVVVIQVAVIAVESDLTEWAMRTTLDRL